MRKVLAALGIAVAVGLAPVAALAIQGGGDPVPRPSQVAEDRHAREVEARGMRVLHRDSADDRGRHHREGAVRHADDPATHDAGDDRGHAPEAEPGDDHGGHHAGEPADDHGHPGRDG